MSDKDLQFIERALAHPWMFWVYFWKWPRIVRQACAEYDLLAKERDAAKAAHERSERANKIVRDWIHVTHRLSTTPEAIRAIFAAGKRLSILLAFFVVTNTYGQAPPYLRNQWTTNANPIALKVISTNGVHAATNVWELDFTNTATVTVSAVSNANKVMVSFTGSASSGSSSLTNALLHAGPTNGSVDALILTAGNGVTLTTSGTNRIAAIDTNVVAEISDLLWTNVPAPASGIGGVGDVLTSLNPYQAVQITTNFLNFWGDGSISMLMGYGSVNLGKIATNNIGIIGIGDYAFQGEKLTNSQSVAAIGYAPFQNAEVTRADALTTIGDLCFQGATVRDSTDLTVIGKAFGLSTFLNSSLIVGVGTFVGRSAVFTNCDNFVSVGQESLQSGRFTNCNAITSFGYQSLETAKLTDCNFLTFLGPNSGTNLVLSGVSNAIVVGNILSAIPLTDEFWFGSTNNVYRFPGNIGTIRGVSGYSWPTAHAAGVWTNDGAGVTGWKPLSDFGGGSGIASIYTNNVLAGGPGLTELGFTNTSSVTWVATTNAGRVTMSASSVGDGSGIATLHGIGTNTSFYNVGSTGAITFPKTNQLATQFPIVIQSGNTNGNAFSFLVRSITNTASSVSFWNTNSWDDIMQWGWNVPSSPNYNSAAPSFTQVIEDYFTTGTGVPQIEYFWTFTNPYTNAGFGRPFEMDLFLSTPEIDTRFNVSLFDIRHMLTAVVNHRFSTDTTGGRYTHYYTNGTDGLSRLMAATGDAVWNAFGSSPTMAWQINGSVIANLNSSQINLVSAATGNPVITLNRDTGTDDQHIRLWNSSGQIRINNVLASNVGVTDWRNASSAVGALVTANGSSYFIGGNVGIGTNAPSSPLHVHGAALVRGTATTDSLKVGIANQATITNILSGSATLDFGSTSSGAVADLAITVTGAASGDVVSVGVPQGSATGIIGSFSGFASNNTVFVRFVPTAATQDPASGTFKVLVTKF